MTNITINAKNATIELTKVFAKNASRFGSEEYKQLQQARADYPNYRVVVRKAAKSADCMKGLTIDYMLEYIDKNDKPFNEELTVKAAFLQITGRDENGDRIEGSESASYGEIKKWFLEQYPEVNKKQEQRDKINAILGKKTA